MDLLLGRCSQRTQTCLSKIAFKTEAKSYNSNVHENKRQLSFFRVEEESFYSLFFSIVFSTIRQSKNKYGFDVSFCILPAEYREWIVLLGRCS